MSSNPLREFFRRHRAAAAGGSPPLPPPAAAPDQRAEVRWDCEHEPDKWHPLTCPEQAPYADERPVRFIDGCRTGETVAWLRNTSHGWPVAVYLAEVGGVSMEASGRTLVRRFFGLERVVSFMTEASRGTRLRARPRRCQT